MNQINRFFWNGRRCSAALLVGSAVACVVAVGAESSQGSSTLSASKRSPSGGNASSSTIVLNSSNTELKRPSVNPESLAGQGAEEVEAMLGKPSGKLQTGQGVTWLYPEWRVQFDQVGKVARVEKDQPVRLAKVDPRFLAAADAVAKARAERAAADDAARIKAALPPVDDIRILSNGGAEVDLPSLLTEGKITIVDFYADWCGPCKQLSPQLEKLAKDDPDVVLLKVDIVDWNTPVTAQFGITSIPNVRVFSRGKAQVGSPTHDVNLVVDQVRQAKGT